MVNFYLGNHLRGGNFTPLIQFCKLKEPLARLGAGDGRRHYRVFYMPISVCTCIHFSLFTLTGLALFHLRTVSVNAHASCKA